MGTKVINQSKYNDINEAKKKLLEKRVTGMYL